MRCNCASFPCAFWFRREEGGERRRKTMMGEAGEEVGTEVEEGGGNFPNVRSARNATGWRANWKGRKEGVSRVRKWVIGACR